MSNITYQGQPIRDNRICAPLSYTTIKDQIAYYLDLDDLPWKSHGKYLLGLIKELVEDEVLIVIHVEEVICGRRAAPQYGRAGQVYSEDMLELLKHKEKVENLPKKLACMRVGRNAIVNNYLMRKVFIPRLHDCVN